MVSSHSNTVLKDKTESAETKKFEAYIKLPSPYLFWASLTIVYIDFSSIIHIQKL